MNNIEYKKVYDFTNENVSCLKKLYHFEKARVLSVIGSGDQYFASVLNGAKKVDVFDTNHTSYLYLILKYYSIRELTYEEFYDFLIRKNICNINVYKKLESYLPKEVLKYYQYLIKHSKRKRELKKCFRKDGINIYSKYNQKYYFQINNSIIPYLIKEEYYKLQEILKNTNLPKFYECNIIDLKKYITNNYDIMLLSNVYNWVPFYIDEYTKLLKEFDFPEIQACYDWYGCLLYDFKRYGYSVDKVFPSSPNDFNKKENFIYSLKK